MSIPCDCCGDTGDHQSVILCDDCFAHAKRDAKRCVDGHAAIRKDLADHLTFLRAEIVRVTAMAAAHNEEFKRTRKGGTLAKAWMCAGAGGGLIAAWNHLTGQCRLPDEDWSAVPIPELVP